MGGGKSSGSSAPVVTQEQKDAIKAQTDFLTGTALPAYTQTIGGADAILRNLQPFQNQAAENALTTFTDVGKKATAGADAMITSGNKTLQSLFDPQYEEGQVEAALQAGRESARESQLGQNAMYGASGGLGSSRMALADRNLSSLNAQRQATAAAAARAGVQANRANAATSVMSAGQNLANTGLSATGNAITAAQSPMDLYSKYASIVYGTPQASTTPNFTGTQGQNTSSKGFGFKV
jgi:hypothetical protein